MTLVIKAINPRYSELNKTLKNRGLILFASLVICNISHLLHPRLAPFDPEVFPNKEGINTLYLPLFIKFRTLLEGKVRRHFILKNSLKFNLWHTFYASDERQRVNRCERTDVNKLKSVYGPNFQFFPVFWCTSEMFSLISFASSHNFLSLTCIVIVLEVL